MSEYKVILPNNVNSILTLILNKMGNKGKKDINDIKEFLKSFLKGNISLDELIADFVTLYIYYNNTCNDGKMILEDYINIFFFEKQPKNGNVKKLFQLCFESENTDSIGDFFGLLFSDEERIKQNIKDINETLQIDNYNTNTLLIFIGDLISAIECFLQ